MILATCMWFNHKLFKGPVTHWQAFWSAGLAQQQFRRLRVVSEDWACTVLVVGHAAVRL